MINIKKLDGGFIAEHKGISMGGLTQIESIKNLIKLLDILEVKHEIKG